MASLFGSDATPITADGLDEIRGKSQDELVQLIRDGNKAAVELAEENARLAAAGTTDPVGDAINSAIQKLTDFVPKLEETTAAIDKALADTSAKDDIEASNKLREQVEALVTSVNSLLTAFDGVNLREHLETLINRPAVPANLAEQLQQLLDRPQVPADLADTLTQIMAKGDEIVQELDQSNVTLTSIREAVTAHHPAETATSGDKQKARQSKW